MRQLLTVVLAGMLAAPAGIRAAQTASAGDDRTVPELIKALAGEIPYHRLEAAKALAEKGPKALPALAGALKDKDWRVRRGAADALRQMGPDANSAAPALVESLRDKDAWVRQGAASALGKMGPLPAAAARALAKAVTDEDPWVREAAIESLKSATQDKAILLSAALAAIRVRHSGWNARRHGMDILWRLGREHKPAVPALVEMLEHPSEGMWDCSQRAVEMLVGLGAGKQAVPVLVRQLRSTNRGVAPRAAASLGIIGKDAADAIPALREMAEKDKDKRNRQAAAGALAQIEGKQK